MVDLETLSTRSDASIISIGAVMFHPDQLELGKSFYASVSVGSNLERGRHIEESTLVWWTQQAKEAQKVFFEPKVTLVSALEAFSEFVGDTDPFIWGNGANFDPPILDHAFRSNGMDIPWKYWKVRCCRTYRDTCNSIFKALPMLPKSSTPHNALEDAVAQAKNIQTLTQFMKGATYACS